MKTPATIDSLLLRIKKEVAQREKQSAAKKLEARAERLKREEPQSIYERQDMWTPVAIYREYEIQHCDCCKQELTVFNCEKVELRHRTDKSAIKWVHERGEALKGLPTKITILERVIPECFCCLTLGKFTQHFWRTYEAQQSESVEGQPKPQTH
jgi:hypothetical protein